MKHARYLIDSLSIHHGNNSPLFNIGKQRNLFALHFFKLDLRTAQQYIWLQAEGTHLFHRVLSGLGFSFTSRSNVGNQSQMQQQSALVAQLAF